MLGMLPQYGINTVGFLLLIVHMITAEVLDIMWETVPFSSFFPNLDNVC